MHIVVCLKQVLDPEIPAKDFAIDPRTHRPVPGHFKRVISTFDECAIEVAAQIKERARGQTTITAITIGSGQADKALRGALSLTADDALRISNPDDDDLDASAVAYLLARAILQCGQVDLVLCGREASDIERGLVGSMLAEELGWPCLTRATRVEIVEGRIRCRCDVTGGLVTVEAAWPAVITVSNDKSNVPRLPKVKDIMASMRKSIRVLAPGDLGLDPPSLAPRVQLMNVFIPSHESHCEVLAGSDGSQQAAMLIQRLRALTVL